jgi:translation initiation factor 2 beta subunit (eIF-2beta)/eIF-5
MGGSASKPQDSQEPVVERVVVIKPPTAEMNEQKAADTINNEVDRVAKFYRSRFMEYGTRVKTSNDLRELAFVQECLTEQYQRVLANFHDLYGLFLLCPRWVREETLRILDLYTDEYAKLLVLIDKRRTKLTTPKGDRT